MNPSEARLVLKWVRHYARQGRITPTNLQAIEADLEGSLARPDSQVTLSQVLHGLGGALLAAAALAAVFLWYPGHTDAHWNLQAWTLGGFGVASAAVGLGLYFVTRNQDLADAFLIAGMACLAFMGMPSSDAVRILSPLGALAAVAIPVVRRGPMVAALSIPAFVLASFRTFQTNFASPGFLFDNISDTGVFLWVLIAGAHAAAILVSRFMGQDFLNLATGFVPPGLVVPFVWFISQVLDRGGAFFHRFGGTEILLAIPMAALLGIAVWKRSGALLVGSSLVLSVDAIVFAFDVGGIAFGVVSLLVVAGAILGLGTYLRKRWAA
jgi:hypothetical protein